MNNIRRAEDKAALDRVFTLRATEYGRCYGNIPVDGFWDDFDELLLPDGRRQATSILFEVDGRAVGTARLTLARHPAYPDMICDGHGLLDFSLEDIVRAAGCDPHKAIVGEVGKLAIVRDCDVAGVKRLVFSGMADQAALLGLDVCIAVMSPMVARGTRAGGVPWVRWPEARLRRSSLAEVRNLLKYHDYFLPRLRKHGLDVDPDKLRTATSLQALQVLASDCTDGAYLWYVRTDDWVRQVHR